MQPQTNPKITKYETVKLTDVQRAVENVYLDSRGSFPNVTFHQLYKAITELPWMMAERGVPFVYVEDVIKEIEKMDERFYKVEIAIMKREIRRLPVLYLYSGEVFTYDELMCDEEEQK